MCGKDARSLARELLEMSDGEFRLAFRNRQRTAPATAPGPSDMLRAFRQEHTFLAQLTGWDVVLLPPPPVAVSVTV